MQESNQNNSSSAHITKKLGLFSLISLVIGSQIGSGALNNPSIFAPYGIYSMYSWLLASIGACSLALVFAKLCSLFPYTGGPHVYISKLFSNKITFFAGWLYWMISWISTIVVLIACTSYFSSAFGIYNNVQICIIGLVIWLLINIINSKSITLSGHLEIILTIMKVIFFGIFIIIPFFFFDFNNLAPYTLDNNFTISISAAMWGFIGLEVATTPAESANNPSINIPKAVLLGTLSVSIIYCLSNLAALGCVNYSLLSNTIAPYNQISKQIFGNSFITNLSAFMICLGSLNAWVLAAGQIAIGLTKDKLLPKIFGQIVESNHNQSHPQTPLFSIWISAFGISLIWIICCLFDYIQNITTIIDALTPGFILIYLLCSIAFFKYAKTFLQKTYTLFSICFCLFLLTFTNLLSLFIIFVIFISGYPIYVYLTKNSHHDRIY